IPPLPHLGLALAVQVQGQCLGSNLLSTQLSMLIGIANPPLASGLGLWVNLCTLSIRSPNDAPALHANLCHPASLSSFHVDPGWPSSGKSLGHQSPMPLPTAPASPR